MTRVLGKGSFHPEKASRVSGAFPTPLPKLGRVGEHGKSPDRCLCQEISTHTHTGERLGDGKPQICLLPTALPCCDPDPTGWELAQCSPHLFVLVPLPWLRSCGGQAGTAPNHTLGKTIWVWNSSLLRVPALLSSVTTIQQTQFPVLLHWIPLWAQQIPTRGT